MKRPISVVLSERLRRRKPGRDLSTQDLMKLFEMRALVYHAMDSRKKMRRDLQRLASMKPTHRLGRLAPPQVRDAFDDVRQAVNGAIRVDMAAQALPGELRINARVRRDATQIGKALYVYTRLEEGDWVQHTGEIAAVSLEEGGQVAYLLRRTCGPGGAILTRTGSRKQPRMAEIPKVEGPVIITKTGPQFKAKAPAGAWVGWGVGAAGLIGGGIIGGLTLKQDKKLENANPRWVDARKVRSIKPINSPS